VLRGCGLLWLAKQWARRNGIIALTLHRILNDEEIAATASLPGMIVRRETFDEFLSYAKENLQVVDLAGEISWERRKRPAIALTFDDGWCDNAAGGFPLARKHGAPMTVFVVPGRAGSQSPFWPEQTASVLGRRLGENISREEYLEEVIERLKALPQAQRDAEMHRMFGAEDAHTAASVDRTMTWEEIERMHAGGVTFGSHTCTHEILTRIPLERAEEEITHSRQAIEKRLGGECRLFAYPNGNSSQQVREMVQRAGYKLAFVNDWPEVWTAATDPYQVPRVNVCEFHLIGVNGKFSPLIFEYAVLWSAVRNCWIHRVTGTLRRLAAKLRVPSQESGELEAESKH
jgi:peptidoglycan/xylan/chitin deacetylase (PgdA/CDA1 family)